METAYLTDQNDRQTQILSRQIVILAGHCPWPAVIMELKQWRRRRRRRRREDDAAEDDAAEDDAAEDDAAEDDAAEDDAK